MTKAQAFSENDHRKYNRDGQKFNVGETFAGLPFEKGVDLADALKMFLPPGLTMADMAQRWILDFDAVTTVITGASRPDQAAINAAVAKLPPLSAELHKQLGDFYHREVCKYIRGPY
jgi:aryl-alcohol dehydrogenase-like predicted oxidoreductase